MKKILLTFVLAALSSSVYAQLNPQPPSSTLDGVNVQPIGVNAGATHWNQTPGLASYAIADDTSGPVYIGTPDNALGLNWTTTINANITAALAKINTNGGIIRTIFLGETAGWTDSLGYTYSGNPSDPTKSFTAFDRMEANGPNPITVAFGDHFDVPLAKGAAANFDLWYSAAGQTGPGPYPSPSAYGGVYTVFHPTDSTPYNAPGNVKFADSPIWVNTWISATSSYQNVATYLVSFEDWNLANDPNPSVIDYSDAIVALQFFNTDGTPFAPVPEPATYGLMGAGALLSVVLVRRFTARKKV